MGGPSFAAGAALLAFVFCVFLVCLTATSRDPIAIVVSQAAVVITTYSVVSKWEKR